MPRKHSAAELIANGWLMPVCCLVIFVASLSCDREPTGPGPRLDDIVYLNVGPTADTVGGFHLDSTYCLLRYHLNSGRFDSVRISLPDRTSMVTSPHGDRLYIGVFDAVLVLDARTWDTVAVLPYAWTNAYQSGLAVSPDGRLLAICEPISYDSWHLYLLRTSDYSVVFADSSQTLGRDVMDPTFSPDSRYLYVTSSTGFYQLDLRHKPYTLINQHISVGPMQSSRDNRTWYYLFGGGMRVYDAESDSVIAVDMFVPGSGDIQLTPDEHYLFYTNPGAFGNPSFDFSIHVMDLTSGYAVSNVSTRNLTDQNGAVSSWVLGKFVLVSPDGRKLLVGVDPGGYGWLILDIATMRIEAFYTMQIYNFTCQRAR